MLSVLVLVSLWFKTVFFAFRVFVAKLLSLASQRLDRIEPRGLHRRVQAEEQPDERRDADAERDRPQLELGAGSA